MTDPVPSWPTVPGDPKPAKDEVHVWRIDLDGDAHPPEEAAALLAEDETRRADAFRFERDRRRFVAGRAALRRILALYTALQATALRFEYGEQGKPELAPRQNGVGLRFNLSHSRGVAICGVTVGREIGVDVERIRARSNIERIATRFFSAAENEALRAVPREDRREAFFRCWTRKEAYLKAVGSGVFGGSTGFDVSVGPDEAPRLLSVRGDTDEAARWTLHDLTPAPGYAAAVLARGTDWMLRLF